MKIALTALSTFLTEKHISLWLKYYNKYNIQIPVVLIVDQFNDIISNSWPYECIEAPISNSILFNSSDKELEDINLSMIKIIQKLNCYSIVGDCFVTDLNNIFKKNITDLPVCDFGIIKRIECSKLYNENKSFDFFDHYDKPNFLERVETHTMALSKDYSSSYCRHYLQNIEKIKILHDMYPESILSLTHKLNNGVYISEDFGWPNDALIRNQTKILEYYYPHRYPLFAFSHYNDLSITFNNHEIKAYQQ